MRIGPLELKGDVLLAPMAGYTNWPMRLICRRMGAALAYTDMISSNSLVRMAGRPNNRTDMLMQSVPEEKPLGIQLFGSDPEVLAEAAVIAETRGADLVDINMGCSVKKVLKSGAGAALLKDETRARAIFREIRKKIRVPLTVKIRSGWDSSSINAPEIARIAGDEGVDAVTVHARTSRQGFSSKADWRVIADTVSSVKVPVIGNGDVRSLKDAESMQSETGCSGVMIGRAARGNPWIFSGVSKSDVSAKEKFAVASEHYDMLVEYFGPERATLEIRKHLAWYSRGLPNARTCREDINRAETPGEVRRVLEGFLENNVSMEVIRNA